MKNVLSPITFDDGVMIANWRVNSADDWFKRFRVKIGSTPQDVSTWEWAGEVREAREASEPIVSISYSLDDAATGWVGYGVEYPASVIEAGEYWYELDLKNPRRRAFQAGLLIVEYNHSEFAP